MNQLHNQSYQQLIASYTGKLLRDHFGKGPESVVVSVLQPYITIVLRNFLTPSERILLQQHHEGIVLQMRDKLMQVVIPEMINELEKITGIRNDQYYYDWNLFRNTGMIVLVCSEMERGIEHHCPKSDFPHSRELTTELLRMNELTLKIPDHIHSYELNAKSLLIVRTGVMVQLEKDLVRLGQGDLLKSVKRNMEKEYILRSKELELLLGHAIQECFVDWNYERDQSVLLLLLNPPS
ncbi:Na-translocating system protein MpsC family protein [Paenibacillus pini]|uniref:Na+-translocating membrane potential-generating system MpsC domain-containing protein n=1 Tax=Paenibacillus pini JCM 16418 TaxID=1236976 RepID=W7Z233_9BACL|nr:Na-translocating system protein MpsC family protein [Paenibacillus pini]GAF08469.1 hypothetical protein JCM16418_2548 [Paenibacillus pini JCM 16418]